MKKYRSNYSLPTRKITWATHCLSTQSGIAHIITALVLFNCRCHTKYAPPDVLVHVSQVHKSHHLLAVVWTHVKAGDNSVVVAAATLWNALPNNIETSACLATFKARLKTHFFLTVLTAQFNVYLLLSIFYLTCLYIYYTYIHLFIFNNLCYYIYIDCFYNCLYMLLVYLCVFSSGVYFFNVCKAPRTI